jgi:hypothetical protein
VSGNCEEDRRRQRGCGEADRAKMFAQRSPASRSEFEPLGKISQRLRSNNTSSAAQPQASCARLPGRGCPGLRVFRGRR